MKTLYIYIVNVKKAYHKEEKLVPIPQLGKSENTESRN